MFCRQPAPYGRQGDAPHQRSLIPMILTIVLVAAGAGGLPGILMIAGIGFWVLVFPSLYKARLRQPAAGRGTWRSDRRTASRGRENGAQAMTAERIITMRGLTTKLSLAPLFAFVVLTMVVSACGRENPPTPVRQTDSAVASPAASPLQKGFPGTLLLQRWTTDDGRSKSLGFYELQDGWSQPRPARDPGFDASAITGKILAVSKEKLLLIPLSQEPGRILFAKDKETMPGDWKLIDWRP
jgi:hypothetical protein